MNFLASMAGKLRNFFSEGYDELFFFILSFLLLNRGSNERLLDDPEQDGELPVLFFIVLAVLLLLNHNYPEAEAIDNKFLRKDGLHE